MSAVTAHLKKISNVTDGFKPMQLEAQIILQEHGADEAKNMALELYHNNRYQARMLAVLIVEQLVGKDKELLKFLRNTVGKDTDWRVQEMLARSFDRYCKDNGYEKSLGLINDWITDKNFNVRRAVSEGLRIWTDRDYFSLHPEVAINILASLKDDEQEYVRKSAGNALRDISKKHADLVKAEVSQWDRSIQNINFTYKLASKFLS